MNAERRVPGVSSLGRDCSLVCPVRVPDASLLLSPSTCPLFPRAHMSHSDSLSLPPSLPLSPFLPQSAELAVLDPSSLLIFSGGMTRPHTTLSEAMSYYRLARAGNLYAKFRTEQDKERLRREGREEGEFERVTTEVRVPFFLSFLCVMSSKDRKRRARICEEGLEKERAGRPQGQLD